MKLYRFIMALLIVIGCLNSLSNAQSEDDYVESWELANQLRSIKNIEILKYPEKTSYGENDSVIDLHGFEAIIYYDDATERIDSSDERIYSCRREIDGEEYINIIFKNNSINRLIGKYRINDDNSIRNIKSTIKASNENVYVWSRITKWNDPKKTSYLVNEEIDLSGMVFAIRYNDGGTEKSKTVAYGNSNSAMFEVDNFDNTTTGVQTITVLYTNPMFDRSVELKVDIVVKENLNDLVVVKITAGKLPDKYYYNLNEELDLTGGRIRISYDDGSYEIVKTEDYNFSKVEIRHNIEACTSFFEEGNYTVFLYFNDDDYMIYSVYVGEHDETEGIGKNRDYVLRYEDLHSDFINEIYNLDTISIPSRFRLDDVIDIKVSNQKNLGLCQLFADVKTLETNDALRNDVYVDLSERYIDYLMSSETGKVSYRNIGSLTNKIEGDGFGAKDSRNGLALYGAPLERDVPYRDYSEDEYDTLFGAKLIRSTSSTITFPDLSFAIMEDEYSDIIKAHIMQYGALEEGILAPRREAYNSNTYGYYYPNAGNIYNLGGHAITIVGWDDNYPKENFNFVPKNNGAWIALNSWGEDWGDNGYFYISYESSKFGNSLFGVLDAKSCVKLNEYTYSEQTNANTGSQLKKKYLSQVFYRNENHDEYIDKIFLMSAASNEKTKIYLSQANKIEYIGMIDKKNIVYLEQPVKLIDDSFRIIIEYEGDTYWHLNDYIGKTFVSDSLDGEWELNKYHDVKISVFTKENYIKEMNIERLPNKLSYSSGEELDFSGGLLSIKDENDNEEIISFNDDNVSIVYSDIRDGKIDVVVGYDDKFDYFQVSYGENSDDLKGDMDNDKKISIIDVRLLLQAYINSNSATQWSERDLYVMDINEDRTINIIDVRLLLQMFINNK